MYVSSKTLGRLLLLLVICLFSQSVKAKYGGGTGEPNNPYQIATSEDLILLGNSPEDYDKHFILTVDINISAYTFTTAVIASDINNTDEWEFQGTTFTGCLDGNGHSITGLTIDAGFTGNDYIGLFGHISASSQVKNLGIENVKISGGDYSYYLGGLAGRNKDGSITNCHVLGSIGARDYTVGIGGFIVFPTDS